MKFDLRAYRDLGKCSTGTLLDFWDTDKDKIFLSGKEVEIKKVEDLFPFLWRSAGCSTGSNDGFQQYFFETPIGYWWDRYEEDRIQRIAGKCKSWIRRKGKDIDAYLESDDVKFEDAELIKQIFPIIAEAPYSKKTPEIPKTVKSQMYKNYMRWLAENQKAILEANK